MDRSLKIVATILILLYLILAAQFTNIQVFQAEALNTHALNPRHLEAELKTGRGKILSSDDQVLAESVFENEKFQRSYPLGEAAAPVTGYLSLRFGRTGLERKYNLELAGKDPGLIPSIRKKDPLKVVLKTTINAQLQQEGYELLKGLRGSIVAVEPKTGAVLAMVSAPSANPNPISSLSLDVENEYWDSASKDPEKPLLNRASQEWYAPGSAWKVITLASALSAGKSTEEEVDCPSSMRLPQSKRRLRNFGHLGYGQVSLARAMEVSCNTTFAQLGMELGAVRLQEAAGAFGISSKPPFELPAIAGNVPLPQGLDEPALAMSAIGQRDVRATPLHMALVAAGIANQGVIMRPVLAQGVMYGDEVVVENEPEVWKRTLSSQMAGKLAMVMGGVVENGTGTRAQIRDVKVAGKTGTAQAPGGDPHAWFIAFAPLESPRIAVAVLVERGGSMGSEATGGRVAAPIAKKIIEKYLGL